MVIGLVWDATVITPSHPPLPKDGNLVSVVFLSLGWHRSDKELGKATPCMLWWLTDTTIACDIPTLLDIESAGIRSIDSRHYSSPSLRFDEMEQPQSLALVISIR